MASTKPKYLQFEITAYFKKQNEMDALNAAQAVVEPGRKVKSRSAQKLIADIQEDI